MNSRTPLTPKFVLQALQLVALVYPESNLLGEGPEAQTYAELLASQYFTDCDREGMSRNEFRAAVEKCRAELDHFPRPSQIIRAHRELLQSRLPEVPFAPALSNEDAAEQRAKMRVVFMRMGELQRDGIEPFTAFKAAMEEKGMVPVQCEGRMQ